METVDAEAYFTPTAHIDPMQRKAVSEVRAMLREAHFDADVVRRAVRQRHAEGRMDRVIMLSALHVVACHPRVADWEEAARLVGEQEFAALELGGPRLQDNLASVDRHRGVIAYLRGHFAVALDYFARALERQRSAENLSNILCTLIRLGEEGEAWQLLGQIRRSFPAPLVADVERAIQSDPDLALLRTERLS